MIVFFGNRRFLTSSSTCKPCSRELMQNILRNTKSNKTVPLLGKKSLQRVTLLVYMSAMFGPVCTAPIYDIDNLNDLVLISLLLIYANKLLERNKIQVHNFRSEPR